MRENIILCGFMGSGKTSVGKRLAKTTGKKFIDLDDYIEEQAGMRVAEIFAAYGEKGFREMESEAVRGVADLQGIILASGGGTVLSRHNVEALHRTGGKILLLNVPLRVLQMRLKNDKKRPLLQVPNRQQVIAQLYKKRIPLYKEACDIVIPAAAPAKKVVKRIMKDLGISERDIKQKT